MTTQPCTKIHAVTPTAPLPQFRRRRKHSGIEFEMGYTPPADQREFGRKLVKQYHIQTLTSCSTCHR